MILKHKGRKLPGINTTSTADISFILLVSFLVMTSMDVDKGLMRQLPTPETTERQNITDIEKRNVMNLRITSSGELLEDDAPLDESKLRSKTIDFISNVSDRKKHVIVIDIDSKAPYVAYFNVQNELAAAYNTLRNGYARKAFGRDYALCTPEQREQVRAYYPQRITETTNWKEGGR
ncbi:MAG: biopolymer transporter ExbD [Prevotella sp.]|nr:biopolymer transporter ExbD [Prevotella sp.]